MAKLTDENRLSIVKPELCKEWSDKNKLPPNKFAIKSNKKVLWKCQKQDCGYEWGARIADRYIGNNCPQCAGKIVSDKNRLSLLRPELCKEWHPDNELSPDKYSFSCNKKVLWKCQNENCGHEWSVSIDNRAKGSGCPKCSFISDENRLSILRPELNKEWHPDNKLSPSQYSFSSNKKVLWKCQKENCGHEWMAIINDRLNGCGCPRCNLLSDENRLSLLRPELCEEWSYKNELHPNNYTVSSSKKVWWKCSNCNHEWKAIISGRSKGGGCQKCSGSSISKKANSWLSYLNIPDDPYHREVDIIINNKNYRVDAYDALINTVYEYHGDYWHGNPKKFNPNEINSRAKKSFGELYNNTVKREQDIVGAGYNLITIWGSEWDHPDDLFYTN